MNNAPQPVAVSVTVAYAPAAREVREICVHLPAGSTVRQAIEASGLCALFPQLDLSGGAVGIAGRKVPLDQVLREHDRVEIWRPLQVDPKLARRERFGRQGARTAGLFAQRRPGGKAGY